MASSTTTSMATGRAAERERSNATPFKEGGQEWGEASPLRLATALANGRKAVELDRGPSSVSALWLP
jgi:hypothetical protein